jgi:Zn-dependent protease
MMGQRWKVVTIRGIPLYVSSSWIWIAILYVWLEYSRLSARTLAMDSTELLLLSLFAAVLFFGSVLVHEGAHAVMARSLGLPVSGITLLFWGGATETKAHARGPLGEFLVSAVGPGSTFVLALIFWSIHQSTEGLASSVVGDLGVLSFVFAGVNALPGFPLDGGRVLLAIIWGVTGNRRTAMRAAGYVGIVVGVALGVAALYSVARNTGWWLFLGYLAAVLIATGRGTDQRVALRDQLRRGRVADAMRPPPAGVPADLSLDQTWDHFLRGTDETFPVIESGRVLGTISPESARKVALRDPLLPARTALLPLVQTPTVGPDEPLDDALEWLGGRDGLVLRDGALIGALGPGDVERWYRRVVEGRPDVAATDDPTFPPRPDL